MQSRRLKLQRDQSDKGQYHIRVTCCPKGDRTYLDSKVGRDPMFRCSLRGTQQHAQECHTCIKH